MKTEEEVITINADNTVSLPATTLTTQQLDELLMNLAHLRANMAPPVPDEPVTGQQLAFAEDAACMFPRTSANGIDLLFRHPGFGWLAFGLSPANAATMGTKLLELVGKSTPHLDASTDTDTPPH